ncbi:cell division protein FtsK [Pseudonocardia sp. Ae717_Ps2]|uniref:cell division protein FtsK n=2 Tax=unclassified Pseudonocardia TaxID=2619320 RepID=UPI00094B144B|nr:cell division protein FtsK [Pseudonocardia sp. Ae717_Ps2]
MNTDPDHDEHAEAIEGVRPRHTSADEHGRRPPAGRRRGADAPTVVDGEVVDGEPIERDDGGVGSAEVVSAERGPRRAARRAGGVVRAGTHVITTAAGGPVRRVGAATVAGAKAAPKVTARAAVTTVAGYGSLTRRAVAAATHGGAREQIRAARAAGDATAAAEWIERLDTLKDHRAQRLRDLPRQVLAVLQVAGIALAVLGLLLVSGGVVSWLAPGGFGWTSWWDMVGAVIRFATAAVTVAATAALWAAIPALVLAGWWEGRRHTAGPTWLATAGDAEVDAMIDETTIARALDALRIAQISAYLKAGTPLQFLTPTRVDGRGTHAVIRLPAGVPAERIARRRADLATGLHRLAKEVWPTTGAEAGILDLWVADKGALAEGAGAYPLLDDAGTVDVFKGVPFGRNLRGTPVVAPLMERNTLTGGMPGQGKSSAARVMMAGAALDPTAELRIWVPDANFDFEAFRPRCSRYVMGAEDERIAEIAEHLRELHAEVQTRGELLVRYEIPAVTREYASKGVGLHPLFCLLEEAHVAIQHPTHGAEVAKLIVDIMRLGRKRGIHLILSTQAPTKDSMPRDATRNASNGIAFAVGDHVANDALLGQGAYTAGHRATELIPGVDRGTAVVKGFSGQRSEIVQVYFLSVDKDTPVGDQVTPLIERALDAIERRGKGLPGAGRPGPQVQVQQPRDLLDDLDAVLGEEPVRTADVPALLARHAPGHQPYQAMTGKALREALAAEFGIKVPSTGNRWPLDPITVRDAQVRRATADLDDDQDLDRSHE